MTFLIGVVNSINCQVEPNLHLENFHFPIFLKPAVSVSLTFYHEQDNELVDFPKDMRPRYSSKQNFYYY
jgi:hypothetical protein